MPRNIDPFRELFDRIRETVGDFAQDMLEEAVRQNAARPRVQQRRVNGRIPKQPKRRNPGWTHYDTLEISPRASAEVIAAAYKAQARRYHPDHNRGKEAQEKMRAVNLAHEILSDATKRKAYDRSVGL